MKVQPFKKTFHIFKDLQFVAERLNETIKQGNKHEDELVFLKKRVAELEEKLGTRPVIERH